MEPTLTPTRRDEDWRYSDVDALVDLDQGTFENWRDIDVAAGESFCECIVIEGESGTDLRRLRVKIAAGARCEPVSYTHLTLPTIYSV